MKKPGFLRRWFSKQVDLPSSTMVHEGNNITSLLQLLPRTKFDYARDVGDGIGSSSIMAPIQWVQRTIAEAPLEIKNVRSQKTLPDHRLIKLLRKPNDFYDGIQLWMAYVFSWYMWGNVYWRIVRNNINEPVQLWHIPSWMVRPRWPETITTDVFISHYELTIGGQKFDVPVDDMIHFRHGLDPRNTRVGLSPLRSVIREVWADDEASNWVASLLRNSGVMGVVLSPGGETAQIGPNDADAVKQYINDMFTGDNRGEPLVLSTKTDVKEFGINPEKMNLSHVRNVAEERVCAAIGIPAAVVGFGSGLEATKVGATMREMARMAWTDGIIPMQRLTIPTLRRSLLSEFERAPELFELNFNLSDVQALQESRNELFERASTAVQAGWLRVDQAKMMVGIDPEPEDRIYLRGLATVEVPAGQTIRDLPEPETVEEEEGEEEDEQVDVSNNTTLEARGHNGNGFKQSFGLGRRRRASSQQLRAIRMMEELHERLEKRFARQLILAFRFLGEQVAAAVNRALPKNFDVHEVKQSDEELERIIQDVPWSRVREEFRRKYGAHFGTVAQETFANMNTALGLSVDLSDNVARQIIEEGGRRMGLADLEGSSKRRLFRTLRAAREEGLGRDAIVRAIGDTIPAGPWRDVRTRSRVIARTETKFAQNKSMASFTRESGARDVMMFDNRIGFDDEECTARDQRVVSLEEAEEQMGLEHPNGTLSFSPFFGE